MGKIIGKGITISVNRPTYQISATAPTDTALLWIDSSRGNLMLVYDVTLRKWIPINSAFA